MSTCTNFVKFWRLAPTERSLFLHAMLLLTVAGVGLRLVSFRRIQGLFGSSTLAAGKALSPVGAAAQSRQTAVIVAAAARYVPYRVNCLPTSLVLRHLLLRQGIQADLRVGVCKVDQGLAHVLDPSMGIKSSAVSLAHAHAQIGLDTLAQQQMAQHQ